MLSPTAENFEVILLKLSNGLGMEVFAPAWFAVLLSLLPSCTFHEGPPACRAKYNEAHQIRYSFFSNNYTVQIYIYIPEKQKLRKQVQECQHKRQHQDKHSQEQSLCCQQHQNLLWNWYLGLHLFHLLWLFHYYPTKSTRHIPDHLSFQYVNN